MTHLMIPFFDLYVPFGVVTAPLAGWIMQHNYADGPGAGRRFMIMAGNFCKSDGEID